MTAETTQWIAAIRELARRAGCEATIFPALAHLESGKTTCTAIAIIGAPNSGKTTLLNALLMRSLIAVTPLPSSVEVLVSTVDAGEREIMTIDGRAALLERVAIQLPDVAAVHLAIDCEWMRRERLCFVEKRAIDATEDDAAASIAGALDGADVMLLVIDATMPIRRLEPLLLQEADRRALPIVVAFSKADMLIGDEERQRVREYVQHYVDLAAPGTSVIDLRRGAVDEPRDIDTLRAIIDTLIAEMDLEKTRAACARRTLHDLAQSVAAAAGAAREASTKSRDELNAGVAQRRSDLELERLAWIELELELERRRHSIEEQVRAEVATQHPALMKALEYEVQRCADVRAFWERDLSFVLQRELRYSSTVIADHVNRSVAADFQWLHEQLRTRFGTAITPVLQQPEIATVTEPNIRRSDLQLANTHGLRMLLGAGASVAVILAGRYLDRARIPLASLAVAIFGLPASDRILKTATAKDREQVRRQLGKVVAHLDMDYVASVSSKIKAAYAEALQALRERRDGLHAAQLDSIRQVAEATGVTSTSDWDAIVSDANAIVSQLASIEGSTL